MCWTWMCLGDGGRVLSCRYALLSQYIAIASPQDLMDPRAPGDLMETFLIREAFCAFPNIGNTLLRDLYGFLLTLKCGKAPLKLIGGRFYYPHQWKPLLHRGAYGNVMEYVYILILRGPDDLPQDLVIPTSVQEKYPAGDSDFEDSDSESSEKEKPDNGYPARYAAVIKPQPVSLPLGEGRATTPQVCPSILYLDHRGRTFPLVVPEEIVELVGRYGDVFAPDKYQLGTHHTWVHHITTEEGMGPACARPLPLRAEKLQYLKETLQRLEKTQRVAPSRSRWAASVFVTPRARGTWSMSPDYRPLATRIRKSYIAPRPLFGERDPVELTRSVRYLSVLGFDWGHCQIRIAEQDRHKTAMTTPLGLWEWRHLPPGFPDGATITQQVLKDALSTLEGCTLVQSTEVLIFAQTIDEHGRALKAVFECLRKVNFKASRFLQITPTSFDMANWGLPQTTSDCCEGWGCRVRNSRRVTNLAHQREEGTCSVEVSRETQ